MMVIDIIKDFVSQNKLDRAIEILFQADNQDEILNSIIWDGYTETALGNINKSIEIQTKALSICEKMKKDVFIALSLSHLGFSYILIGELEKAFDYLNRALLKSNNFENPQVTGVIFNHLGVYYQLRDDIEKGLEYLEMGINLGDKINKYLLGWLYYNAAKIYRLKNNIDKAKDYFDNSLLIFVNNTEQSTESDFGIACNLIRLIILNLSVDDIDSAKKLLDKFSLIKETSNKMVQIRKNIGSSLILKTEPRAIYKYEAQKMLSEIVKQEVIDHEFTLIAMVNLCDLLLDELQAYNQEEVFLEIESLLNQLFTVSQKYKSYFFLVESLILKSKFALVRGKISEADELLQRANFFANEMDLKDSIARIAEEQQKFRNSLKLWENLSLSGANINEKLKEIEIKEYIKHALNAVTQL